MSLMPIPPITQPATVILAMGTRPEIIKMAPVALALQDAGVPVEILHTGQHDDRTVEPLYAFFGLAVRHGLALQRSTPGLGQLSAELLGVVSDALTRLQPAAVLVHGDTSSALMAALAAFYLRIPIGHVEAGLRSGSLTEPFPEEMNRRVIGRMARWHFAPTAQAVANLQREGVETGVQQVGNTVVDAVLWASARLQLLAGQGESPAQAPLQWLQRSGCRQLVLVTAHRRENWGEAMRDIARAVHGLLQAVPDLAVIWPLHPNPEVQQTVRNVFQQAAPALQARWLLTLPLDYAAMVTLMQRADVLLTDSGGIQEEGVSLRRPVLVLRNVTERPELIDCGAGMLVGTHSETVLRQTLHVLRDGAACQRMQNLRNPFGDGLAAQRIAQRVGADLGLWRDAQELRPDVPLAA